ncbi:hypothetical protein PG994_012420 [Apiospora phragmitis]|uniref:Uncharacterized protein n=1 Tax=Apiospora phragmitis TaxID=2905665 RepID=A0ABR1TXV6_9PEZI
MKYATAAATLLPLAWAANIDARAGKDTKFNISQLKAECDSDKGKCSYNLEVATGDSDSTTSCKAETTTSQLGAAPETKCGPYALSVSKTHDGSLIFIVDQGSKGLTGSFNVNAKELQADQSYKDGSAFDVAAKATLPITDADEETVGTSAVGAPLTTDAPKPSMIASHGAVDPPQATAKASSVASQDGAATAGSSGASSGAASTGSPMTASSIPSTAVSGISTMVTATAAPTAGGSAAGSDESSSTSGSGESSTSDSESSSSASPSEESGATRQSAFAGIMAVVGLMAFAF